MYIKAKKRRKRNENLIRELGFEDNLHLHPLGEQAFAFLCLRLGIGHSADSITADTRRMSESRVGGVEGITAPPCCPDTKLSSSATSTSEQPTQCPAHCRVRVLTCMLSWELPKHSATSLFLYVQI